MRKHYFLSQNTMNATATKFFSILFLVASSVMTLAFTNISCQESNSTEDNHKEADKENGNKGDKDKDKEKSLKIGNLAMPVSQQPSPLVSFGQNIIDKNQTIFLFMANDFVGKNQEFVNLIPSYLFAFSDETSIFISAPSTPRYRHDHDRSSGIEDLSVQFEYAFYTKEYKTKVDQATIVANVTFPTGSNKKKPPTGFGAHSFFIGATLSRMTIDWFYYTSHGGIFTESRHGTKFGSEFLYQFGIGKNIANLPGWLFAWQVEVDGIYTWRDKIHGKIDKNSGGNVIYLTPSLWVSSDHLQLQLGVGYPVQQHLYGHQNREEYLLIFNIGWTL